MKLSSFNPRPWLIGESILLMIVFYFTGVLGTLMPPHEIDLTVSSEGASPWVEWLLNKDVIAPLHIQFIPSFQTILLIIISFVFLTMIIFSFKKQTLFRTGIRSKFYSCLVRGIDVINFGLDGVARLQQLERVLLQAN